MRKWINIAVPVILLAVGVVVCILRWQAWFGMPAEPIWYGDVNDYQFPLFEQDSTPDEQVILVLGDVHNRLTRTEYDTLAARVPQAEAVLQVGDWMDRGQNYYYQLLLREWIGSALYGLPVITTPGNHEYTKGVHKTLSPVWEQAFPHPDNGPVGVPGASYYVDLPNIRFISIDTNPLVRVVDLTRTLTWVRGLINTKGERYVVVVMHHPVYAAAKGRFNSMVFTTFHHVLSDADLVLAGHDHSYMRKAPFVVLNAAGKPKAQRTYASPEVTDSVPVYGVLTAKRSDALRFKVYHLNDHQLIDSIYVKHD